MNCPSCGAEYADWARVCPYCGTVNENADERAYLDHMDQLRKRLDNVDEEAESSYLSGVKGVTGKVLRLAGIAVLAALAVAAAVTGFLKVRDLRWEREEAMQKEWESEAFPVLDELYASGDYGKVLDKGYELIEGTDFYFDGWPHYWFVFDCFGSHEFINYCRQELSESGSVPCIAVCDALELICITDGQIETYMNGSTDSYNPYIIIPEEAALVRSYREDAMEFILGDLGFTPQEREELKEASFSEYGFLSYSACADALERMGKTEVIR